ncbi:DUF3883 domain-containing protein [Myxococcota bacterium]|nr:DUF3883 domain-containing protein [Myxococcota bacterium]
MRLQDIKAGVRLQGIEPDQAITVIATQPLDEGSLTIYYKRADGALGEQLLQDATLTDVYLATTNRPWSFEGDGATLKRVIEAKRIELAYLFDPMMAIHAANVEPLPHQITAVYESMLPRQPLRYVLADDPGAGKTIMAGLYLRELIMRADAQRILVIAPGSLVEQWRDELYEKFGLEFRVFGRELEAASPSGNPFEDYPQIIARLDQISRSEALTSQITALTWDVVIFDEAHKLSAHFFGSEIRRTKRFLLAEQLSAQCRHLLLMTATPHNGKEEDFQLFLSLLDPDRFYGRHPTGVGPHMDASDLMRRMVKEELIKFDSTPLFPERRAYTANYALSESEAALYERVTTYVKEQMGKADALEGRKRNAVGFALTTLQRRLASSPEAIFQSLKRRKARLEKRLEEARRGLGDLWAEVNLPLIAEIDEDDEDAFDAAELEALEAQVLDEASAAQTITELEAEVLILGALQQHAQALVHSGQDRKWDELSRILQGTPQMRDAEGRQRKLILFSEHRDTLNYLRDKIAGVLGDPEAIVTIHGGTPREARRHIQEMFRADPKVRVLIATDAAGEGVNLQVANLMVNYDLPWNPNRLEQRFGRIHRIGQVEVCHLWNLVAKETREGDVYHRLLDKLHVESLALQGRVFDILGEVFEGRSLRDLLIEAIRYGDQPQVRARLYERVDRALDHTRLEALLQREALARETLSPERLFAVKAEMEKAEARRLQPHFLQSFFTSAFESLGGTFYPRELGRFEITYVPPTLRQRGKGTAQVGRAPVLQRYERVCFTREAIRPTDRPGRALAALLHPGHPLMMALTGDLLARHGALLHQGAVLIDPQEDGESARLLFLLIHEIKTGAGEVLSKRLQFVWVDEAGAATPAGWAPHLDLDPLEDETRAQLEAPLKALLDAPWLQQNLEQHALTLAARALVPQHTQEISARHMDYADKVMAAVNARLTVEIDRWTREWERLRDQPSPGKEITPLQERARRTALDLGGRLNARKAAHAAARHVISMTPRVVGGALVLPQGLLRRWRGEAPLFAVDVAARRRTERLAMEAVRADAEARGARVVDVSAEKCGWDLTVYPADGSASWHVEVKGRHRGATTLTVTRNEILYALNQADRFVLAVVFVDPLDDAGIDGPFYVRAPFSTAPDWGVASWNMEIKALLDKATRALMTSK